jgi:hypothetical protein
MSSPSTLIILEFLEFFSGKLLCYYSLLAKFLAPILKMCGLSLLMPLCRLPLLEYEIRMSSDCLSLKGNGEFSLESF